MVLLLGCSATVKYTGPDDFRAKCRTHVLHSALALAQDSSGAWAAGCWTGATNPALAAQEALRQCEDSRNRYGVQARCELRTVNGNVLTTAQRPAEPAAQPSGTATVDLPPPMPGPLLMRTVPPEARVALDDDTRALEAGSLSSKNFLGYATRNLKLRDGPGRHFPEISQLVQGEAVFIFSLDAQNHYLQVIRIETDEEGWVHQDYVTVDSEVPRDQMQVFTPTGTIAQANPEIEIWNNTDRRLTVALNEIRYRFGPQERRTMSVAPGAYSYRASAPGVIPCSGTEVLAARTGYSWQFFIETVP